MSGERKRLTQREREAAQATPPYPGNVNQPDREFKRDNQYDNWDETLNHPTPDMRHEWQDNPRDGIGYGISKGGGGEVIVDPITKTAPAPSQDGGDGQGAPTVASVKVAASKAVRLSYLLLGEKTPEDMIEDQARDFMSLASDNMDRTLARFAETQQFYADDEKEEEGMDDDDAKEASNKKADEAEEKAEEKAAETIQEDKEEAAKEASDKKADGDKEEEEGMDDDKEENKEASKPFVATEEGFAKAVEARVEALKNPETKEAFDARVEEEATKLVAADEKEEGAEEKAAETIQEDKEEAAKEASDAPKDDFSKAVQAKIESLKADEKTAAKSKEAYEAQVLAEAEKVIASESKEAYEAQVRAEAEKIIAADKKAEGEEKKEEKEEKEEGDSKEASKDIILSGPNEMDIELTATMDEVEIDPEINNLLQAALFGDDEPELPEVKEASEKQGVTKLGGQPKVASDSSGQVGLSDIWASAPDVSEVFN